jgi:outer membrane biosynthesis protein TonB
MMPEGAVTVQLAITPEGLVDDVSLSEPYAPAVAKALQEALGGWLFLPRLKAGEPVRSTVRMPLKF